MSLKTNIYFGKTIAEWRETEIGVLHKFLGGRRADRQNFPRMMYDLIHNLSGGGAFEFIMPENLLCIAGHNHGKDTVFEEQMKFHSQPPEAYTVVHFDKEKTADWSHFLRWKKILSYIKKAEDKEYVLCMDPTDCLFIDSPHNILNNFLTKFDCDILFNSTTYFSCAPASVFAPCSRGGYRWDLLGKEALEYHELKHHKFGAFKHINGGLCIGKRESVIELYERLVSYEFNSRGERVEPADPSAWLKDPEFPYGCADDQQTLRFIEHEYYPEHPISGTRMRIDGRNELFIRIDSQVDMDYAFSKWGPRRNKVAKWPKNGTPIPNCGRGYDKNGTLPTK